MRYLEHLNPTPHEKPTLVTPGPRQLRQDVPGADGWRWDRQGFRRETWDAPDFDPATYLVAIERAPDRRVRRAGPAPAG